MTATTRLGTTSSTAPEETTTTTNADQSTTTSTQPLPLAVDCATDRVDVVAHYEPSQFYVICGATAASQVYIDNLVWSTWTSSLAVGSGTFAENTCQPSCADSNFAYAPATLRLTEPAQSPYGLIFTHATLQLYGTVPYPPPSSFRIPS